MKQEHQVVSLKSCINELQQQSYAQRLELQDAHQIKDISNLEENKLGHKKKLSMKEKVLRDTQKRKFHEMGKLRELKNYELTSSQYKN